MPATAIVDTPSDRRLASRSARYDALRVLWRETNLRRIAYCRRIVSDVDAGVTVKLTGQAGTPDARAGFSGLQTCGSVWACPVCSERVNAARQAELQRGITGWLNEGHAVLFGTFTLRHHKGQRLKHLWDAVSPAWNRATSGAGVAWNGGKRTIGDKAMFGIRGSVRVVEVKHGERNGWHPHVHFLLFIESELTEQQRDDLRRRMFGRWQAELNRRGLDAVERVWNEREQRHEDVGLDLRPVVAGDALADYFTKNTYGISNEKTSPSAAAYEVTGSHSKRAGKGGRTPFQILEDVVTVGLEDDLALWYEWEHESQGRRQLTWARGTRTLLGLDVERTDEELAEDDALDGEPVFTFTRDEWCAGWASRQDEVLELVEAGTWEAVFSRWWTDRFASSRSLQRK